MKSKFTKQDNDLNMFINNHWPNMFFENKNLLFMRLLLSVDSCNGKKLKTSDVHDR